MNALFAVLVAFALVVAIAAVAAGQWTIVVLQAIIIAGLIVSFERLRRERGGR
jgi:hypothetical protein